MAQPRFEPAVVGVDGRAFGEPVAGIARYVVETARELAGALPRTRFVVYSQRPLDLPFAGDRWTVRVEPHPRLRRLNSFLWFRYRTAQLSRDDGLDAYWANATFVPRLPSGVPVVAMAYDLVYRLAPQTMRRKSLVQYRACFARDLRRADAVLALSQGTADRLRSELGLAGATVALPGVDPHFAPPPAAAVAAARQRHGLADPYLFAVATLEPRKNLGALIEAYRALGDPPPYALALAGRAGWRDEGLRATIDRTPGVRALGFVEDADLPALYAGAAAVVVPSTYEGFGLPAMEARACGARLLCSDIPELREAGGPSARYVAPTVAGLAEGLRAVDAIPPAPRTALPGWDRPAHVLADALRRVATNPSAKLAACASASTPPSGTPRSSS